MKLSDFYYELPEALIAQEPLAERDQSRLLVLNRTDGSITHDRFANIGLFLPKESQIVCNNSRVVPARLLGKKLSTGAKIEVFLTKRINDNTYEVLLKPLKRLADNDEIVFEGSSLMATVVDRERRIVRFNLNSIDEELERIGHMPLPPYIKRNDSEDDKEQYQTVYAKQRGSVAAPTAGLHFTQDLIQDLIKQGHRFDEITLHVNYGTFKPVECEDIKEHPMHSETYQMTEELYQRLKQCKQSSQSIVAVGTTSCRVLESVAQTQALSGETNIFIYPGFSFKMVDHLITNFHLPCSTLIMLVSALAGRDLIMQAYAEAIKEKYRFYSYGDAMMII